MDRRGRVPADPGVRATPRPPQREPGREPAPKTSTKAATVHPQSPGSSVPLALRRLGVRVVAVVVAVLASAATVGSPAVAADRADGRHYELATPPDKLGHSARAPRLSEDGTVLAFDTHPGNGLPGDPSHSAAANPYQSQRTPSGWRFENWGLDATIFGADTDPRDVTPNVDGRLFNAATSEQKDRGASAWYVRRSATAPPEQIGPVLEHQPGASPGAALLLAYKGASNDLRHVVLQTGDKVNRLLPEDPIVDPQGPGTDAPVYEVVQGQGTDPSGGVLRRVDLDDDGAVVAPRCGAEVGSAGHKAGAVSEDGSRIFFAARPGGSDAMPYCLADLGTPSRLFVREEGRRTVELTASECVRADPDPCTPFAQDATFEQGSSDGHLAFFTTFDQLVTGDTDAALDLYAYDLDAPSGDRLVRVSEPAGAEAGFRGFIRATPEASRAYFVAGGVLADNANGRGDRAVADADNLYAYDTEGGATTFVATLDPGDARLWTDFDTAQRLAFVPDADPDRFFFSSVAPLVADDTDASSDLFRFDAGTASLVKVSAGADGRGNEEVPATAPGPDFQGGDPAQRPTQNVSADGSHVLFHTTEALVPDDVNDAGDVYEWADGRTTLVSDGVHPGGAGADGLGMAISADGGTVAFATDAALLPSDTDTAVDIYVLRGGADASLPAVEGPKACEPGACQSPPTAAPATAAPATPAFVGPGNVRPGSSGPGRPPLGVPARAKARGSVARLRIRVPAAGRLAISGPGLRRTTRSVSKAGAYTLRVSLTAASKRALGRTGSVDRRATVRLTLADGRGASATARIAYTTPKRASPRPRAAGATGRNRS